MMSGYRRLLSYGVAICSTAIALLLSLWLEAIINRTLGAFFYMAIAITTWYGGIWPGMTVIVLSALSLSYYFLSPIHQFWVSSFDDVLRLLLFLTVAMIISLLSDNLQKSKRKVEQLNRQLAQENTERLQVALNAAQMGLWDWNLATGEITWSPEHEQLLGLSSGSFDGKYETFDACLHPEDRSGLNQAVAHSLQSRIPYHHEFRVIWADGSIHWVEGRGNAQYDAAGQPIRMSGTIMAIDGRKHAEIALQEQEALLRLFAQYAPAGIAMLNRDMRYVIASQQWVKEYGLESVEAIINRSHYEVFPEVPERWRQIHQRCLAGAIEKCDDDLLVRADGSQQWLSWEIRPWYRAMGDIGGIVIFSVDITPRKLVELELRDRERLFSTLAETLPVVVFRFDQNSHCVYINNYWTVLAGRTIESVAGLGWVEALHPEDRDRLTQEWLEWCQNSQQRGLYQNEGRLIHRDGRAIWYYIQALPEVDAQGETVGYIGVMTNITDRKQAEESLRQSEARLRLAQVASNSAVWDWDIPTNTVTWSPEYYQLYDLDPTVEANYENWLSSLHPDDRERTSQQTLQALEDPTSELRVEFRVPRSGTIRWFAAIGQVLRNEAGVPIRMIGITIDITAQKQTEIALQHLNAELESRVAERTSELTALSNRLLMTLKEEHQAKQEVEDLYNNAPCGYHSLDINGSVIRINNTELNWLGYSRDEVVNKMKFIDLLTPDSQPVFYQNFPKFLQQGWINNLEFQLRHQDGSTRWVNLNSTAVRDELGDFVMSRTTLFDITDRKETEAVLREAERRWRSLLDNVQLVVIGLDINGNIEYANPFFLNLTGYQLEEVTGQSWFEQFLSSSQKFAVERVFQEILEQKLHTHYQNPILTKTGEERMVAWSNTVLQNASGASIGTISIGEDITERYKVDRMKAEFISVVSHELRTPLTSMQAALSLLNEKIIDPTSEEGEVTIQIATEGTDRLVRLVNDILDLERLESGKVRLEKHLHNVDELVNTAIAQMQELANQSGILLAANPYQVQVTVDGDRLLQVLTNLLSNAIKFSPKNSMVRLSMEVQPVGEFPALLFAVHDQGRGIPADKLESIFDRFHQVDASDSREKGGTGLGLAICRSIVQQHGGEIWAESTLNQGSTFYFTIPI